MFNELSNKQLKNIMLNGGVLISQRNDIAYYSKIDNKFLLRFYNFGNYDEYPVLFDFKYIHTFKIMNFNKADILKWKLPYKIYIGEKNFFEDKENIVFFNKDLRKLEKRKKKIINEIENKKNKILSSI